MMDMLCKAKRKDTGEWVRGQYIRDYVCGKHYISPVGNCLNESNEVAETGLLSFFAFEIEPETLCRDIGFCDKMQNSIFENDLVRVKRRSIALVCWDDTRAGYVLKSVQWECDHVFGEGIRPEDVEVIDNLFHCQEICNMQESRVMESPDDR